MATLSDHEEVTMRALALFVFVAGAALLLHATLAGRITDSLSRRLRKGMTKSEVIEVLGHPHGKYQEDVWHYLTWSSFDPLPLMFDDEDRLE